MDCLELGGQLQGVSQPFTPMGSSVLRTITPVVARFLVAMEENVALAARWE